MLQDGRSKVSVNPYTRRGRDFENALKSLEAFYITLIQRHVPFDNEVQLFCVLALDGPVEFEGQKPTSLPELPAVMVEGLKGAPYHWFSTKPTPRI